MKENMTYGTRQFLLNFGVFVLLPLLSVLLKIILVSIPHFLLHIYIYIFYLQLLAFLIL